MRIRLYLAMLALAVMAQLAWAQPPPLLVLPDDLAAIRDTQARLAGEQDVGIRFLDEVARSASSLDGVPLEFRDEVIETEHDLVALLDRLYPYYGFTGTETLEFEWIGPGFGEVAYHFRQYIGGLRTNQLFSIQVDANSKRILGFRLWLYLDRDLPREPAMSRQHAIDVALCFVDRAATLRADQFDPAGPHELEVVYEAWGEAHALIPVWRVVPASAPGSIATPEGLKIMPGDIVSRDMTISHGDSREPFLCAQPDALPDYAR